MKILTVTYSLNKGGVARTAQIFAEGYRLLGHDSRVLVTTESGHRQQELEAGQIPVWKGIAPDTIQTVLDWNPAVVHLHSHSFTESEMTVLKQLFPGRTVVEKNVFSRPVSWTARMDYSYQLSVWCAWKFCNAAPDLSAKAVIVPNGANTSAFVRASSKKISAFKQQYGIPDTARVVGRIGQLYDTKWSPVLIDSFNSLSPSWPDLYLLLVDPSKAVRKQAEKSPVVARIIIIDKIIGDAMLSTAYSTIEIFALAADQGESFGNVLAESMLCETPVVALSTPWQDNSQCEVVGHNIGGLIALTPKGFCKAIDTLLQDQPRGKAMGRAGRNRIIENFNRKKVAQISLDVIAGESRPLNLKKMDQQIIDIYKNAFETPSPLTLWILKDKRFLRLTRYTTHYWPIWKFPGEILKIIAIRLQKLNPLP